MKTATLTAPVDVRGDAYHELPRCMPVVDTRPVMDHNGALTDRIRRGIYAGNNSVKADEGLVVWTAWAAERTEWPTYIGNLLVDWGDPTAVHLSLDWLATRGHERRWFLPTTHGGRTADWNVAGILASVSVGRVVAGLGPASGLYAPWAMGAREPIHRDHSGNPLCEVSHYIRGWRFVRADGTEARGSERGPAGKAAADRAALDDGAALLGGDGAVTVGVPDV